MDIDMDYSGSQSNRTELLKKAAETIKRISRSTEKQQQSHPHLEMLLRENKKSLDDQGREKEISFGRNEYWRNEVKGTGRNHDFEQEAASQLRTNSTLTSYDFQIHLTIPNDTFPTSRSSFDTFTSSLHFDLKTVDVVDLACLNVLVKKEKRIKPSETEILRCDSSSSSVEKHSEINHELSNWVLDKHKMKDSAELWRKVFDTKPRSWNDENLPSRSQHQTVQVTIVPRIWSEPKRTQKLEEILSTKEASKYPPFHYSEESSHARAPMLIKGSQEEIFRAVDLLVEERKHHESIRTNSSAANLNHLDASFPIVQTVSSSSVTLHSSGMKKYKLKQIKRKLGSEHMIPKSENRDDEDDFAQRGFQVINIKFLRPGVWRYPAKRGSAALDIGLIWNENVMLDILKGRRG